MCDDQLTEGALLRIMRGEKVQDPIVQVLMIKKIPSSTSDKQRYRLLISDGRYQISYAMLTTQTTEPLEQMSVFRIKKYIMSDLNKGDRGPQKVLLIMETEMVLEGSTVGEKIGTPEPLTEDLIEKKGGGSDSGPPASKQMKTEAPALLNQSLSDTRVISQIATLTPYHNKWVIKARVANKSEMRTWSNSRGEGKLFSVDLMDESGEIRCTAFRDVADKYFNYIQVDKVYYISKAQLKTANKQFNTLKNDYEMTLGNESIIEECLDDNGLVPKVKYSFIPIEEVVTVALGTLIDVIGVCKEATDVQTFTSKTTNRELKKREVTLVDQSKNSIALTLWGTQAETFDPTNNPVVVIKGAKVSEFGGGKNLSSVMSTQVKVNPDIPECHRIKGWYDLEGKDSEVKNLSEKTGVGNFQTAWMCLKNVHDTPNFGLSEKGDYFQTMATILLVRSENAIYKACPTQDCNKKVVDLENGMYRCEKCNREYPNFKYRLLVSMNIGDYSGNQWVTLFSSEAEKILGKTSQEVGLAMEDSSETASAIFHEANFKQFFFKCRAKMEMYNDEERLKIAVVRVDPVDYEEYNSQLLKEIEKMMPQESD